mgnify:FL=1|jgi:site-specific recombinase XerC
MVKNTTKTIYVVPDSAVLDTPQRATSLRLARKRIEKAYGVLADQPPSLAGLSSDERAQVVVSAVIDEAGNITVISRAGDPVWNLWPFVTTPNTKVSEKRLNWERIPESYRECIQNVVYAYWKQGRPGWALPGLKSLLDKLNGLVQLSQYAAALKLSSLADLQPLHIANFVHDQKATGKNQRTLGQIFAAVELLYLFRGEHQGTLGIHPWPESSAKDVAGLTGQRDNDARKVGLTPLIPMDVASILFKYAESILEGANFLLEQRDSGKRSSFKDTEITAIRDACFYLLGVLTGMRSSELSSIEVEPGRTEVHNGFTFHWLTSTEHKTKKGEVDYLMPSLGHRILRIMERWSRPYRQRLSVQIKKMEEKSATLTTKELQWLARARSNAKRMFLGNGRGGIVPVSGTAWVKNLGKFARSAGTNWALSPHQTRRLYAYTFVRHKLGDLLFLKEQFKHSSIDMSQLYGSNPRQDRALYDDILSELLRYKGEVITTWLEKDEPLAGGAGHKIMKMRAHEFQDRKAMVTEASRRVQMRSNGHAWCLAQDDGCGGSGIYAKGSCGGCRNGLVDRRFIPIWQEAYRHHKELLREAQQWGPGAIRRVSADLEQAGKILRDLGLNPEGVGYEKDSTY